jgi:hypothetical protein
MEGTELSLSGTACPWTALEQTRTSLNVRTSNLD